MYSNVGLTICWDLQAARAYDAASRQIRGDAAIVNFADEDGTVPIPDLKYVTLNPPPWIILHLHFLHPMTVTHLLIAITGFDWNGSGFGRLRCAVCIAFHRFS